jgi:ABC-type branched-subunit amino acid transport system ATPase component/ABC-type branched-subunit amino acid transport system permease subunit
MILGSISITIPSLTLGLITGMTYGIFAVGLVIVYRSSRIINFAHVQIGVLAAAIFDLSIRSWHIPYWVALPFALVIGAVVGFVTEVVVIRRFRRAPAIMSIVATLGAGQFMALLALAINANTQEAFPEPSGLPAFNIGALTVTPSYTAMLFFTPVVVVALVIFFRKSRFGLGIRAAAVNADAARVAGISANSMSGLAWALAGIVSAYTVILILPTQSFTDTAQFSANGLLFALAAAILGRMTISGALVGGLAVGVIQEVLVYNYPSDFGGPTDMVLFALILVALLIQRRPPGRERDPGSYLTVQPWRRLPEAYQKVWAIRNASRVLYAMGIALAVSLPLVSSYSAVFIFVSIVGIAMVGLSVGLVTGLGGFVSLGQFAVAAVGAGGAYYTEIHTNSLLLAVLAAGVTSAAVSGIIGIPALRIRGLMLAVTTLAFADAASGWLLSQNWMFGQGVSPLLPAIGSISLANSKSYYYFSFILLVICWWLCRNVWRGGVGRKLTALRDNESAARSFTVSSVSLKLQVFCFSGFIAGVGGAVFALSLSQITTVQFPLQQSVNVVAMTALGGIGLIAGPMLGALYIIAFPAFVPLDNAGLAATSLGWLILILYSPGGIAQMVRPVRQAAADWLARRHGLDPVALRAGDEVEGAAQSTVTAVRLATSTATRHVNGNVLEATDLSKNYSGVSAISDVTLSVTAGETLGLIGPNGAGKTTLFELLSGFTRPDAGRVVFVGDDITDLSPEARARRGLIRSFQDVTMFPTMTVLEALQLAQERVSPTRFRTSILGWSRPDRRKLERARDIVHLMGLDAYRTKQVGELSTGTRHIAELACLIALEPTLLLLDEPSSGVAQRETEVLGDVLEQVKANLGCTLLIIEHDMPLITRLADRIVAMDVGAIIADGTPDEVTANPLVIESYLGGDIRAIQRSGELITNGTIVDTTKAVTSGQSLPTSP